MREDILEGLRIAVSKGEPLQNAMQSFYNAGYKKEEIEEAARTLQMQQQGQQIPQQSSQNIPKNTDDKTKSLPQKSSSEKTTSIYGQKTNQVEKNQKLAIVLLGIVLFVLLVSLLGVLFFKEQIVGFFKGG